MLNKRDIAEGLSKDRKIPRAVTQESFRWFLEIFFSHYLEYQLAPFHEEMIHLAESDELETVVVMAFRGSGKSTILNAGYALWSILGRQRKKCVLIISHTQAQAKNHFANIKQELETNKLLANDLGPFRPDEDGWGTHSLELPDLGAKIISISRGQNIRGIRYNQYRPDLVILDDVEDTAAQTDAERLEHFRWYMDEVVPTGTKGTKFIVLGNLIHRKSLLMQLRKRIADGGLPRGIFRAYPLVDHEERRLWPQKFPTRSSIQELQDKLPMQTWDREYMLSIIPRPVIDIGLIDFSDLCHNDDPFDEIPAEQAPVIKKMKRYCIRSPVITDHGIKAQRKKFG